MKTFRRTDEKVERSYDNFGISIIIESNKNRLDRILLNPPAFPSQYIYNSLSWKSAVDKKYERWPTCSSRLPANGYPRDRSSISLTFHDPCQ